MNLELCHYRVTDFTWQFHAIRSPWVSRELACCCVDASVCVSDGHAASPEVQLAALRKDQA